MLQSVAVHVEFVFLNCCHLFFQCDNHEIRPGKFLGVCISVANNRLFVGSIPKNKTRESIVEDFSKVTGLFQVHSDGFLLETEDKSIVLFDGPQLFFVVMLFYFVLFFLLYRGSPRRNIVPPAR